MTGKQFDAPDLLNDDGTVTIRTQPSNWHRYNISPDTYQTFTGDSWEEGEIEHFNEQTGRSLTWDDFNFDYNMTGVVRDLSQLLADWLAVTLRDIGLTDVSVKLGETWSPREYNFTSDGFEVEITCDPKQLRELTPGFDVDAYGTEHYSSYDGFASFVPGRLEDDNWHAEYDGGFRIESLLADDDPDQQWAWRNELWENEWEVYADNVTMTPKAPELCESWGTETPEIVAYALELTQHQIPGQLALDN